MTKIATRGKCNIIEAGNINRGSFLGDFSVCPTYKEITEIGKLNVSGTYESNQLVKESDITRYTGNTKNICIVWGEYQVNFDENQVLNNSVTIPIKFHATLLKSPDVPIKINITYGANYKIINGLSFTPMYSRGTATINISNPTVNGGVFGATVTTSRVVGGLNGASFIFDNIVFDSITITPSSSSNTSIYDYIIEKKGLTKCNFNLLNIKSASLSLTNYTYYSSQNYEECEVSLNVLFNTPTGSTLSSGVMIYLEDMNYNSGSSFGPTYNQNTIVYKFMAGDDFASRGYKLPYYTLKINVKNTISQQNAYLYAIFNHRTEQTGIELTDLILEE